MKDAACGALPQPPAAGPEAAGSYLRIEKAPFSSRLRREVPLLGLILLVIGLSAAMPALRSRGLWPGIPCVFHKVTGLPCLTCGLTRSFSSMAHGDLENAFYMHLLGPVLFVLTGIVGLYLVASLAGGYRVRLRLAPATRRAFFYGIIGVFAACWVIKILFMKGSW